MLRHSSGIFLHPEWLPAVVSLSSVSWPLRVQTLSYKSLFFSMNTVVSSNRAVKSLKCPVFLWEEFAKFAKEAQRTSLILWCLVSETEVLVQWNCCREDFRQRSCHHGFQCVFTEWQGLQFPWRFAIVWVEFRLWWLNFLIWQKKNTQLSHGFSLKWCE